MTNSADPDQLASSEANWSGSTLFAKTGHDVFNKRGLIVSDLYSRILLIIKTTQMIKFDNTVPLYLAAQEVFWVSVLQDKWHPFFLQTVSVCSL